MDVCENFFFALVLLDLNEIKFKKKLNKLNHIKVEVELCVAVY